CRGPWPRCGAGEPVNTLGMTVRRRISAAFKDLPGGQILGPTFDYTHRLLEPQSPDAERDPAQAEAANAAMPRVTDLLADADLVERSPQVDDSQPVGDLTQDP